MNSVVSQGTRSLSLEFANRFRDDGGKSLIFALFDQMSQIDIPNIFIIIPYMFICFQWVDISIFSTNSWDLPALFQDGTIDHTILLILYTVVFVISIFSFVFPVIFYKLFNRFLKWSLYFPRFCFEIMIPLFLAPIAWEFGYMFNEVSNRTDRTKIIVFLILDIIYYLVLLVFYIISQLLLAKSIYMSKSVLYTWSSEQMIFMHVMETIMVFLIGIVSLLPDWTGYIFSVFHFVVSLYIIYTLFSLPFFNYYINAFFAGLLSGNMISDITYIAKLDLKIRRIMIFPIIIVGIIIYSIIFYFNTKKILKVLKTPEQTDNSAIDEYFRDINVDNNMSYYLHIGLKERGELFINFALIKYGIKINNTDCLRTVALFPSQIAILNVLYKQTVTKVDVPFGDRFMLYQINRVKFLRQSSSSIQATEQLDSLKNQTRELKSKICSIWAEGSPSYSELSKLGNEISLCSTNWKEAITNIPNSQMIRDEYVKFLINVETDFTEACKQHYFSQLIGSGRSFTNDVCFRSLVHNCPEYLKRGIVDTKGNVKIKGEKKSGGSSTNSSKNMTESISSTLDAKMEESIGKIILKNPKLRLALQNSLENKRPSNLRRLTFWTYFNLVIGLAVSFVIYFMFKDFLDDKFTMNQRNMYVKDMQLNFFLTAFYSLIDWASSISPPRFIPANASVPTEVFADGINPLWNGEDIITKKGVSSYDSRKYYRSFINSLAELSNDGTKDVYAISGAFLIDKIDMPICTNGKINGTVKVNLKTFFLGCMSDYSMINSTGLPINDWWTNNKYMCMGYSGTYEMEDSFETMRNELLTGSFNECQESHKMLEKLEISIPVCVAVVLMIPFSVFLALTVRETTKLVKMMIEISDEVKIDASRSIVKVDSPLPDQSENTSRATGNNVVIGVVGILVYLMFVAQVIIMYFMLSEVAGLNDKFMYMDFWCLKNSLREGMIVDATICVIEAVIGSRPHPIVQYVYNETEKMIRAVNKVDTLSVLRTQLLLGTDEVRSILGYDEDIDFLLIKPKCETKEQNTSFHDMYSCGAINQQISFYEGMIREMNTKIEEYNSTLDNTMLNNLIHLALAHIIPQLRNLDARLNILMLSFVSDFDTLYLVLFVVGLVISILMTLVSILFIKLLYVPYDAALKVLRKVHPIGIVNLTCLMDYLYDRNSAKQNSEMNTTRAVIHNWSDAVIITSAAGTIDQVNQTVTKVIGYTPEQLLGQNVSILFSEEDKAKITQQFQLMLSKQSAPYYEDHLNTVSDTEQYVPCLTMLFGVSVNGDQNGDIASFVVILHDETEIVQFQEQAEKAKKQSEDLLYQILPRDIVIRLNQGEKDISFEVPSASFMFVDIVKFSDFSASLTLSEIMGTLSTLFGSFDESLMKYPLITKIKLIGDVYMCASGLFTPDESPSHHAEQLLRFGLEALQIVDEINVKMTANLSVRVGMNSGGPLIAGVLGTDKPVFDIIGDTINVASRLQSTDISNRVQISQGTFDLVSNLDFNIEPRGEVFLKGKGKSNAFLVRPLDAIGSCISSNFQ